MSAPDAPTRPLDRLLWRQNDEGGWEHRLADEWNGNESPRILWSRFDIATLDTRYTDIACGLHWTHWGIGVDVETSHERPWIPGEGRSTPTRRTFVTLTFGPFYLSLHDLRPRKGFDYNGPF
jgi:hypothetical protein